MASIGALQFQTPDTGIFEATVSLDSSVSNTWNIALNGTGPNGETVLPKFVVIDNTGNAGIVFAQFQGAYTYSVSPYTRKTFSLLQNQSAIVIRCTSGIVPVTFSNVNLGIPDDVNQYASSSLTGGVGGLGFNPSDKNANVILSNSNFSVAGAAPGTFAGVRSISTHAAGKFYIEGSQTAGAGPSNCTVGVAVASANLAINAADSTNLAGGAYWQGTRGTNYPNPALAWTALYPNPGIYPNWKMAINCDLKRIWWAPQGAVDWNGTVGFNPQSNTGGVDISGLMALGVLYLWCCTNGSDTMAWNFGLSPANDTIPVGYNLGW